MTVERTERTAKDENLRTARPGRNLATRERERKATVAFTRVPVARWRDASGWPQGRRGEGGTQRGVSAAPDSDKCGSFLVYLCAFVAKLVVLRRILWVIVCKLRFHRPNPDVTSKFPLRQSAV